MKHFIATDIGGTTFNTGLFNQSFELIEISPKDKIRNYSNKEQILNLITTQILTLINKHNLTVNDIIAFGLSAPGPLDANTGIILDTINLKMFQNYNITKYFKDKLKIDTYVMNDANLFAYGEWFSNYSKVNNFIGITLGTGFGVGFIYNGQIFLGSNGMAMEYGLSPYKWGPCEKNISIKYIREKSKMLFGEELSPRIVEKKYFEKDINAISIYEEFGYNLGQILSHIINLIDPQIISIGGGLSNAFKCFEKTMLESITSHCPGYAYNKVQISPSESKEISAMVGACIYASVRNKGNIH